LFIDNSQLSIVNHQDHVFLLQKGVLTPGGIWADFGSGGGAFTLALADLLGSGGVIYSIDRDGRALRQQAQEMARRFPGVTLHTREADDQLRTSEALKSAVAPPVCSRRLCA